MTDSEKMKELIKNLKVGTVIWVNVKSFEDATLKEYKAVVDEIYDIDTPNPYFRVICLRDYQYSLVEYYSDVEEILGYVDELTMKKIRAMRRTVANMRIYLENHIVRGEDNEQFEVYA